MGHQQESLSALSEAKLQPTQQYGEGTELQLLELMRYLPPHAVIQSICKFSAFQASLVIIKNIYKYEVTGINPHGAIAQPGLLSFCVCLTSMSLSLPEPILKSIHLEAYFISY